MIRKIWNCSALVLSAVFSLSLLAVATPSVADCLTDEQKEACERAQDLVDDRQKQFDAAVEAHHSALDGLATVIKQHEKGEATDAELELAKEVVNAAADYRTTTGSLLDRAKKQRDEACACKGSSSSSWPIVKRLGNGYWADGWTALNGSPDIHGHGGRAEIVGLHEADAKRKRMTVWFLLSTIATAICARLALNDPRNGDKGLSNEPDPTDADETESTEEN